MTITDTTATTAATTSTATSNSSKSSSAVESSDFKSFLSLLTAQLKNQDPLAPLEATQFVEQLASFSSVEQQIETNSLLEELLSSSKSTGLDSATSWIGKEVEASASSVNYAGESLDFAIPSSTDGTATRVVVRNSSNDIVYSENIAAGQSSFSWDGEMSSGDAAPAGDVRDPPGSSAWPARPRRGSGRAASIRPADPPASDTPRAPMRWVAACGRAAHRSGGWPPGA